MTVPAALDLGRHVAEADELVVQPRMGMAEPASMAAGLAAVARSAPPVVGTVTLDSFTRVGKHEVARDAVRAGHELNGFPIVAHGPGVTAAVVDPVRSSVPVQIRHGSPVPEGLFEVMAGAGVFASEGGPVSYCLPYGRTPLAESVGAWRDGASLFGDLARARGARAHLETFGGCLLGQLCPPSLLVAMSLLEALFFVECGVDSVSLSYAQQTHPGQDVEALAALRLLADAVLPAHVERHVVVYTYMGVFPSSLAGARRLLDRSVELATRGGAERLIVKTAVEAQRIPTVEENLEALRAARGHARDAARSGGPALASVDCSDVLDEARALVDVVLGSGQTVGDGLLAAFRTGRLDVPWCLHRDNAGATRAAIDHEGRLRWVDTGRLPFPAAARRRAHDPVTARDLLGMLRRCADEQDQRALGEAHAALPSPATTHDDLTSGGRRGQ